jgi:hypothetical protein
MRPVRMGSARRRRPKRLGTVDLFPRRCHRVTEADETFAGPSAEVQKARGRWTLTRGGRESGRGLTERYDVVAVGGPSPLG